MIKLIATDMDGTLVGDDGELPRENIEAFRAAAERDILIVIATGRPFPFAIREIEEIGVVDYFIGGNGSIVRDVKNETDILIDGSEMTQAQSAVVCELAAKYDICPQAQIEGMIYQNSALIERFSKEFHASFGGQVAKGVVETEDVLGYAKDFAVQRFNFNFFNKHDWYELFDELYPLGQYYIASSWKNKRDHDHRNFEITTPIATKGQMVRHLCEKLEIEPADVIAFGDSSNDIEMLKFAGIGVAMDNASSDVKKIADYITASNSDAGVAQALSKFL